MRYQTVFRCGAIALLLATAGCRRPLPTRAPSRGPWIKGQLHAHTARSDDSRTPPERVVSWYEARGYDFLVLTDHNRVTRGRSAGRMLVIPGVELTQNVRACDPAPEPGLRCILHMNALFVTDPAADLIDFAQLARPLRLALYSRAMDRARSLGGLVQLNHPNFHYAVSTELLETLARRGLALMEIANQSHDVVNHGAARHPSTEALWDDVLSRGFRVWGTATDDAHHYDDADQVSRQGVRPFIGDLGFVMVRAARNVPAIRAAIERGDFYASNGVLLDEVRLEGGALHVEVARETGSPVIRFIGQKGRVVREIAAHQASLPVAKGGVYLRAVVTDAKGRKAWTQPVMIQERPRGIGGPS